MPSKNKVAIQVRLFKTEHAALVSRAQRAGLSVSEFVRRKVGVVDEQRSAQERRGGVKDEQERAAQDGNAVREVASMVSDSEAIRQGAETQTTEAADRNELAVPQRDQASREGVPVDGVGVYSLTYRRSDLCKSCQFRGVSCKACLTLIRGKTLERVNA
jgi:hypothetical protein